MKLRLLCILLTAALLMTNQSDISGNGAPLSVRLGVPDTIQGEFISQSGISRVIVDAEIIMPEVSQADIVEALPRVFSTDEISSFIGRCRNDLDWYYAENGKPYDGAMPVIDYSREGVDVYRLWINTPCESTASTPEYRDISIVYGLTEEGELGFFPRLTYMKSNSFVEPDYLLPLTDGRAEDCTITLEEAIAYADAEVHAIAPDYAVSAYGQLPLQELGNKQQYYVFRYTRHLNGIPVNDSYAGENISKGSDYTAGLGVISAVVRDNGVCYLGYYNPYDTGGTVYENVNLLPFDDIWDIFQNVSLMSIQNLEISGELEENTMEVYEIRFGYMSVRQADGSYWYTPVWDFYARRRLAGTGSYAHADETRPVEGRSELTINAIDGTIINRSLGY